MLVGSARPKFVVSLPQLKEGGGELDMENYVQVKIPYGEKFSWDKIFAVFTDLPQTAEILTAKFYPLCKPHPFPAIGVALQSSNREKFFAKIFASGQSAKILSRENFSPYGTFCVLKDT